MPSSVNAINDILTVRDLGRQPYLPIWEAMQSFTDNRTADTADELWLIEHDPVFTQGQAGKQEHLLAPGDIPVVQVDRGGQVTYHGPGQLVVYVLLDLKRRKIGVRDLVTMLENTIVSVMKQYGVEAFPKPDAPGVYVGGQKLCSLGLRIRKGCSFHGLAFNVNMDLTPFQRINPCGYAGMTMTDSQRLNGPSTVLEAKEQVVTILSKLLKVTSLDKRESLYD